MCIWVKIVNPQNESTSMDYWNLKLKATKFGWFLGTIIRTIFYLGPICCGHWLPITITHTLIPAQPPLPVFSFLLPVVPPECMPKLQLSTAKSQKLMQEKDTAICKNKTYKKHVLRNAGEILWLAFAQSCSSNRNKTLHRMPESF